MGTLSDIAAKFKNTLAAIPTVAGDIKSALKDTASKYGESQGFIGNVGSVAAKGIVGASDIVGGTTDFLKSQAQQVADYAPAAYELITTGKAPVGFDPNKHDYYQGGTQIQEGAKALSDTVSLKPTANLISEMVGPGLITDTIKGASNILDPYQNVVGNFGASVEKAGKGDPIGSGIALGMSVLSALPFKSIGNLLGAAAGGSVMEASGANKALADATNGYTEKRVADLVKNGYSENDALTRANNESGGLSLAIGALSRVFGGSKLGGKGAVAETLKKPVSQITLGDVIKHNIKYGSSSAGVQSMESSILNYISGADVDPITKENAKLFAGNFVSGAIPGDLSTGKIKSSKKGSLSKIAEENVAQTKMDVTPEVKVQTPALPKGIDETVADYVPVEKVSLDSQVTAPKLLSDLAKEQANHIDSIASTPEIKTEGAPNIEPTGGNAPPTVYATELGNILNSLDMGDDVFVSKSKNILNKVGTEGGYIEKGLSKIAGRIINLRNISMTARTSANLFANKILEVAGVDKNNFKLGRDFLIKESDVVGGVTPNEGTKIDKYSQVAGTLKNMIPNSIKNFIGKDNVKDLENLSNAEYVYMTNKGNQAKLDELFSPEEQARFAASEQLSKDVPQQIVQFLKDNDLIKDEQVAKDYVRFVLSEYGREKFSKPVVLEIGGKEYKFENMEAAMSATQARRKIKEDAVADSMGQQIEAKISSILKEKGDNIDLFRVHSPTIQLLSYSEGIGKLLQNKATLDNFRKFAATDEKGFTKNPENAKFIEGLFPDKGGSSEILNNMIHVYGREKGFVGATKNVVSNVTRYASAWLLSLRLPTFIQPIFSTIPKSGMTTLYNELGKGGVRINYEINNKNVDASLANNGFMSDLQVFDTAKTNAFDKGLSKVAGESSGAWLERQARRAYALSEMAHTLVKNGIDIRGKWKTVDPTELVTAWDKWARDPANKEQYLVAQDKIQEYLSWMGESSIMSKSMNDTVRKTNFQALTGYANSQVNKALTDIGRAIGKIETGEGQQKEAIGRLVMGAVPYFGTALASLAYLQSQNPEADIGELWSLSLKAANRTSGNFLSQWYSIISGQTSSPILLPVSVLGDLSNIVGESLKGNPDGIKQAFDDLLKKVINTQGGLSTINAATKGEIKQGISDALGTVNTETLAKTGKAKGNKIDSYTEGFERALGLNTDAILTNYMYGQINDAKVDNMLKEQGVTNPTLVSIFKNTAGIGASLVKDLVRPIQEGIDGMLSATDIEGNEQGIDYNKMTALNEVYKKITPEDTTETILSKLGVSKDLVTTVDSEIQKLFESEAGNTTGMGSANKLGGIVSETPGYTYNNQDPLGKRLEAVRITNPKLFNDIIASFGKLHGLNKKGDIPVDKRYIDAIKETIFKPSSMQEDAIISAISGDNPNSTALSQSIFATYQKISDGSIGLNEKKSALKVLDSLFGGIYGATGLGQGIERSIALSSFKLLDSLKKEMNYSGLEGVQEMIKNTPNILKAIQNGLTYRGFNSIPQIQGTTTAQPASVPQQSQGSLSAIASSMYGKKAPKWTNVKHTSPKIEPLIKPTKTMSLSDLARSQSSKLQKKSVQRTK